MGYLVVAHAMNVMPELEPLSTLPMSIGWSLHQDESIKRGQTLRNSSGSAPDFLKHSGVPSLHSTALITREGCGLQLRYAACCPGWYWQSW